MRARELLQWEARVEALASQIEPKFPGVARELRKVRAYDPAYDVLGWVELPLNAKGQVRVQLIQCALDVWPFEQEREKVLGLLKEFEDLVGR